MKSDQSITEVTRRNIIDYLLSRKIPFHGRLGLISFLKRVWDLSNMESTDERFRDAEGDIWQHMINNGDWDYDYLLLDRMELLTCGDEPFLRFLAECLHPVVLSDPGVVSETLTEFNKHLEPDAYRLEPDDMISGRHTFKARRLKEYDAPSSEESIYEVVLSFAGEEREYVEQVAEYLKHNGVKVFYDKYEEITLWGKELTEHLDKVYRGSARYCVIFISKNYANKIWTSHEKRSALARALKEKKEYILPARFDDTELEGIRPTIGYVDLSKKSPEQLGQMIVEKLGRVV